MKIIGIIGGMGPEATAQLYYKLIKQTPAKKDQEHYKIVVYNNPHIPDRTEAILGKGTSPVKDIIDTGKELEKVGVTVGCMTCITAHYFFDEIQNSLQFPLINSLAELNFYLNNNHKSINRIGVLATTGTIKSRLFNKYLSSYEIVYPPETIQKEVMKAIYSENGIKSGNTGEYPKSLLKKAGNHLIDSGAQLLIAGCTEVPLAVGEKDFSVPLLDPMDMLARALIDNITVRQVLL